jgi:hypothetical protein
MAVIMCTTRFNVQILLSFAECIYWLRTITTINRVFLTNSVKLSVFVMDTQGVFCDVSTEFSNIKWLNFMLHAHGAITKGDNRKENLSSFMSYKIVYYSSKVYT